MGYGRVRPSIASVAVCSILLGITGCGSQAFGTVTNHPGKPQASGGMSTSPKHDRKDVGAASTSGKEATSVGWYFVPTYSTYGANSVIAGITVQRNRLKLLIRTDSSINHGTGFVFSKVWHAAWFDPAADTLQSDGEVPAQTQITYQGPVKLVFPTAFPGNFERQSVTVDIQGKSAAKWPAAIPMYGSAANPEGPTPGSLDNQILGQVGNWIWVALKGPQYPPFYPNQKPLLWAFRFWDRLVAFNLQTGQAVEYSIPRSDSEYVWAVSTGTNLVLPTFVRDGSRVWVAVGQWVGCFPSDPLPTAKSESVVHGFSAVLRKPSASYVHEEAQSAMADLQMDEREVADSLASYWDTTIGANVPGVPSFRMYQDGKRQAWNLNTVIYNHGDLPSDLLWAMQFPFTPSDPRASECTKVGKTILALLRSPLNADAIGVIQMTPQQVEHQFHNKPPVSLPGYVIRGNAYWPDGA